MKRWLPAGLLGLSLLWSGAALADPKDDARRHFNSGLEYIANGDYDSGIAEFERAYEIIPHPVVLYNIARAYADVGEYEKAIEYFEMYLETEPVDRTEVEGYIRTLQSRLDSRPVVEDPVGTDTPMGTATSEELAQLRRHAEELSALAETLAAREAAALEAGENPDTGTPDTPDPGLESGDLELGGELVADLYSREVVTASRFGQDPLEAPAAVSVITSEDIELSGATSIPDLLARVPGVDVMQLTAGYADVSVRGFNRRLSNKTLVLIDGRSVYLDFVGNSMLQALPVTLDEVDRIEIIRGPGSAIYGANAFAGVVNIITKTPGDLATQDVVSLTLGTKGQAQGSVMASGREGDVGYRMSAGYEQLGRWAQEVDLDQQPQWGSDVQRQDLSLQGWRANGQLDFRLPRSAFASVSGGVNDSVVEFYSLGALRNFYLDQRTTYTRVDAGVGPVYARVFYNRLDGTAGDWYYLKDGNKLVADVTSNVVDATVSGEWAFGQQDQHKLLVGLNYRYKDIAWGFIADDQVQHHFGGYIQEQSRFGPILLDGAIRVDRHPLLESPVPSPRLAVIANVSEGRVVRVNGGTAFRTPTFMESYAELYLPTGTDGVSARTVGDEALLPERILAVEAAYLDESAESWRAEVTVYGYQVDNLIDLGSVDSSALPQQGYNPAVGAYLAGQSSFVNEAPIYRAGGGEVGGEYFGLPGLDLYANYAFEWIVTTDDSGTSQVRATPRHKLNGGLTYRSPIGLDTGMHASWVDKTVWGIRSFDEAGQVQVTDTALAGRVILTNTLSYQATDSIRLQVTAWNWLADVAAPQAQHPLGQPVGSRYSASLQYGF